MLLISFCAFSFETLIPAEASGMLSSLLDVVSRLSRLLPKAGRVLERLPEFLHTTNIPALLDAPVFHQVCVYVQMCWASVPWACTSLVTSSETTQFRGRNAF